MGLQTHKTQCEELVMNKTYIGMRFNFPNVLSYANDNTSRVKVGYIFYALGEMKKASPEIPSLMML